MVIMRVLSDTNIADHFRQYPAILSEKASPVSYENLAEHTTPIRVLVANVPTVLYELMARSIQLQPDMVLVGQVDCQLPHLLIAADGVDVLVLGADRANPLPRICGDLLSKFPFLRILVLATASDSATLYWLGLRRQRLAMVSVARLVYGIRQAFAIDQTQ